MTTPRDPDALLVAYLADGMEVLPDRVVDAVLGEVHRTRQRAVSGPWRTRSMDKTALGAAAVFAALVLGGAFYLFQHGQPAVVGGPSQTPVIASPTPGASASSAGLSSPSAVPSGTPVLVQPRAPSSIATGSMGAARRGHTATMLLDGKVLVAGGENGNDPLASAELYDPRTGTWTPTGSMANHAGIGFTSTLLPDGKVLVAGGHSGTKYPASASAELYDPSTGTWTATGSMGAPRKGHTATLLANGKVLVAGGFNNPDLLATAELYDPGTGTWTATGSLGTARYTHSATLLHDGKVLVAGGGMPPMTNAGDLLDSAELYDPGSGTWTATGTMVMKYNNSAAVLLPDGKVLVGAFPAELYDPVTRFWTATGATVISGWFGPAALLTDGRVLVLGAGTPGQDVSTDTAAALFDSVTDSWTAAGKLGTRRWNYTATLLADGRVLVAGGWTDPAPSDTAPGGLASAELYDPGSGQ